MQHPYFPKCVFCPTRAVSIIRRPKGAGRSISNMWRASNYTSSCTCPESCKSPGSLWRSGVNRVASPQGHDESRNVWEMAAGGFWPGFDSIRGDLGRICFNPAHIWPHCANFDSGHRVFLQSAQSLSKPPGTLLSPCQISPAAISAGNGIPLARECATTKLCVKHV